MKRIIDGITVAFGEEEYFYQLAHNTGEIPLSIIGVGGDLLGKDMDGTSMFTKTEGVLLAFCPNDKDIALFEALCPFRIEEDKLIQVLPGSFIRLDPTRGSREYAAVQVKWCRFPTINEIELYLRKATI